MTNGHGFLPQRNTILVLIRSPRRAAPHIHKNLRQLIICNVPGDPIKVTKSHNLTGIESEMRKFPGVVLKNAISVVGKFPCTLQHHCFTGDVIMCRSKSQKMANIIELMMDYLTPAFLSREGNLGIEVSILLLGGHNPGDILIHNSLNCEIARILIYIDAGL